MLRIILALVIGFSLAAAAAESNGFSIEGQVTKPVHLTAADLKAQPPVTIDVAYQAEGKIQKSSFTGVPLLALLTQAGVIDGKEKGAHFRHSIEMTGADGYVVAVSMGEIDPNLEAKQVLIAYARDGKPLPGDSVRLVVPGDHHGARDVRDLVKIEVK